jgi:monovalent cation/hydrogen antiporter
MLMPVAEFGILVALLVVAIPLIAFAKRFDISYPIVLVVGGLVLGFVPGLPTVQLSPELVLLIFLPPLLYW